MTDEISKITSQKLESTMYQLDNTHFQTFPDMIKYLQAADNFLLDKITRIDIKIESVNEQFVRTASVYQMNNKTRKSQQQMLASQRQRIAKDIQVHKERLAEFTLNPITLVLKQKKYELEKLNQTKQIIEEFYKLVKGKQDEIKKIMPLDQKNFNNSAMKIYVFKVLLQDIHGDEYEIAKLEINKKYTQLKNKIIQNFKQGFWNKDSKLIRNSQSTLPYCEEYELMDEISEFYNQQIFKSVHKVTKLNYQYNANSMKDIGKNDDDYQEGQAEIKNMFFLIEQGFNSAFSLKDQTTGENNPNQINAIMGQYSESVGRKLVTYVFQKIIRQSLESILKSTSSLASGPTIYLTFLQIFYDECKKLIKSSQKIIKQDRTIHLMSTYFQSIFDTYLDTYLTKQLNNLDQTYEKCTQELTKDISENAVNGATTFARERQKNGMFSMDKKKTIKNLFNMAIESKKNIFQGGTITKGDIKETNMAISEAVKLKIQNLLKIFMNPSLEKIFSTTKKALARNKKIAKINEVDRNRNQILQLFLSNIEQIIQNLISLIAEVVPPFDEKSPTLEPDFFQLVPQINMLLQRIEFMYEEYKKQNRYRLADTIKLDQNKQNLMVVCGKSLSKVVGQAMATILATEGSILQQDFNQYNIVNPDKTSTGKSCQQIITFLQRYIRVIQKIHLTNFRLNILKTLGLQFVNHLIKYYSQIPYTKQGLSKIFMDIAKYKTTIVLFMNEEVENKFKVLRSLIDIYVIKNDERSIEDYVKGEANLNKLELKKTIDTYILNKIKCEKVK